MTETLTECAEKERAAWWQMGKPRGSLRHLLACYCFPMGALSTADCGAQAHCFLVHTRAASYSVVCAKLTQKSSDAVMVTGVTGQLQKQVSLQPLECQFGDGKLIHCFCYMPVCPIPLLGQDFLCKLHARITTSTEKQQLCVDVPLFLPPLKFWLA